MQKNRARHFWIVCVDLVPPTDTKKVLLEGRASLKFRVLPLGNAMTVLISSSLINPVSILTVRANEIEI